MTRGRGGRGPPFCIIARADAGDPKWLHAWRSAPHPSMPNFDLARQRLNDAYLDRLWLR